MKPTVKFVDSVPEPKGPNAYIEVKAALRSQPMRWAEIDHAERWGKSNAYAIRTRWAREGYEVDVRTIHGVIRVFARYTGEVTA